MVASFNKLHITRHFLELLFQPNVRSSINFKRKSLVNTKEDLRTEFLESIGKPDLSSLKGTTKVEIGDRTFYCVDLVSDNLVVFDENHTYVGIVAGDDLDVLFNNN